MAITVAHLIIGLGKGGAETMLYNLLKYKKNKNICHKVITFGASHYYEKKILDLGVQVIELSIKKRPLEALFRARKEISNCDVLNCWMYHCNFIGYYLFRFSNCKKIIWNIRHCNLEYDKNKASTVWIAKQCIGLSKKINYIAYNGEAAKNVHESLGYFKKNSLILDNGCDLNEFYFLDNAKKKICNELSINENSKIILSASKYHPIKDIPTFIKAYSLINQNMQDTIAIMCGNGIDEKNVELLKLIEKNDLKLNKNIFLIGMRHDLTTLMSASDIFILHSASEAFPNTLIQAMACEAMVLSTDVGEVGRILCDNFYMVKIGDYLEIMAKVNRIFNLTEKEKDVIKNKNHNRIKNEFNIEVVVSKYEKVLQGI